MKNPFLLLRLLPVLFCACMAACSGKPDPEESVIPSSLPQTEIMSETETVPDEFPTAPLPSYSVEEIYQPNHPDWARYMYELIRYPRTSNFDSAGLDYRNQIWRSWAGNHIWLDMVAFESGHAPVWDITPGKAHREELDHFPWLKDEYRRLYDILQQDDIPIWDYEHNGTPDTIDPNGLMCIYTLPASSRDDYLYLDDFDWTCCNEEPIRLYTIQTDKTARLLAANYGDEWTIFPIKPVYQTNYDGGIPCFDASRGLLLTDRAPLFALRWEDSSGKERFLWLALGLYGEDLFLPQETAADPILCPEIRHISINDNMVHEHEQPFEQEYYGHLCLETSDQLSDWMIREIESSFAFSSIQELREAIPPDRYGSQDFTGACVTLFQDEFLTVTGLVDQDKGLLYPLAFSELLIRTGTAADAITDVFPRLYSLLPLRTNDPTYDYLFLCITHQDEWEEGTGKRMFISILLREGEPPEVKLLH